VQMFPVDSRPTEYDIYGIIFHREAAGDKAKLGTLSVGIPNERCDGWLEEPIDLVDLADAQDRRQSVEDGAKSPEPKWKDQRGKKEDEG